MTLFFGRLIFFEDLKILQGNRNCGGWNESTRNWNEEAISTWRCFPKISYVLLRIWYDEGEELAAMNCTLFVFSAQQYERKSEQGITRR